MERGTQSADETLDNRFDFEQQYLEGGDANVRLRFNIYRDSVDRYVMHDRIIDELELAGHETVVDVGCASGDTLVKLRTQHGHYGPLIGIDRGSLSQMLQQEAAKEGVRDIEFRVADATDTGLETGSADVLMALFMLYHVPQPENALKEFQRVIRPGGQLVVATSGPGNKRRHRQFEREAAALLGIDPPPVFSEWFDTPRAQEILPRYFHIRDTVFQESDMEITPSTVEDYMFSLQTMGIACNPPQGKAWRDAIEEVARPVITREIETYGSFTDSISRSAFICENNL